MRNYQLTTGDSKAAGVLERYQPVDWTVQVTLDASQPTNKVLVFLDGEAVGDVPVLPYNSIPGMVNNLIKRHEAKRQAPPSPAPPAAKEAPSYAIQGELIYEIPLSKIGHFPGGNQRTVFDQVKLEELAASIRTHGVIQPIVVNEVDGAYLLMAGERRLRASHMAGLPTIPARVRNLSEAEALEVMAIENLQREDLNPMDEALAYRRLLALHGTQAAVAERVGVSRVRVTEYLQLLDLPAELQQQVATGQLSVRAGLDFLRRTREAPAPVREKAARVLAEEKPTAREAPTVIDRVMEQEGVARATSPKREVPVPPKEPSPASKGAPPAPQGAPPPAPAEPPAPQVEAETATIQVSTAVKMRFDELRQMREWTADQFLEELMNVWEADIEGLLR